MGKMIINNKQYCNLQYGLMELERCLLNLRVKGESKRALNRRFHFTKWNSC